MMEGLTRAHPWNVFSWERTGIGMSVPYDHDCAASHDVKGQLILGVYVTGLHYREKFHPLRVEVRMEQRTLIVDRALHPARLTVYEPGKEGEPERVYGLPFLALTRERIARPGRIEDTRQPESPRRATRPKRFENALKPVCASGATPGTERLSAFEGRCVERLRVIGNRTMAVGLLPHRVILVSDGGLALILGLAVLEGPALPPLMRKRLLATPKRVILVTVGVGTWSDFSEWPSPGGINDWW